MEPLMLDVPESFDTERLTLRCVRPGDGAATNVAIRESFEVLHRWMRWADTMPTEEESELQARRLHARFASRDALPYIGRLKDTETFVLACSLHRIDWEVPRFEIGYWVHVAFAGHGYVSEAVRGLTRLAFGFGAKRVEIRVATDNERSYRVAERCGYELEGVLRRDNRWPNGELKDMRVYSRIEPLDD